VTAIDTGQLEQVSGGGAGKRQLIAAVHELVDKLAPHLKRDGWRLLHVDLARLEGAVQNYPALLKRGRRWMRLPRSKDP